MRVLKTTPGKVSDVAFSPDCRAVAAAVEGVSVFLWNLDSPTLAPVRVGDGGTYRPGGLRFAAGGRHLSWQTATGSRTYDRDSRATSETVEGFRSADEWHLSDDGTRAVSLHRMPDHFLAGWRHTDGEWVRQWKLSTRGLFVASLALVPDGARCAMFTCRADRGVQLPWRLEVRDAATGAELAHGTYAYSYTAKPLRFHPHGEQVAGINEMTLLVWPLPAGGAPRLVRNDSRKHFTALAYHPSGRVLFVTSNDATVHVFDTHTLARAHRYTWHLDRLSAVAVSPDGTLAAAGSATGDVVVWDLD